MFLLRIPFIDRLLASYERQVCVSYESEQDVLELQLQSEKPATDDDIHPEDLFYIKHPETKCQF